MMTLTVLVEFILWNHFHRLLLGTTTYMIALPLITLFEGFHSIPVGQRYECLIF